MRLVSDCRFTGTREGDECSSCGYRLRKDYNIPPKRNCSKPVRRAGDALEDFLASYGITIEWYIKFKTKFGLPPTCDCPERKEWINKTADAHPTIANIGMKLLSALKRK